MLVLRVVFRFLQSMNCCKRLTPKNDPDCLHNRKEFGFGSIGSMKKGLDGRFELSAGREGEDKMLKLIFGFELLRPMFAFR